MIQTCRSCGATKKRGHYLCGRCWYSLSPEARRSLWKADDKALSRLGELYDQIDQGRPLADIRVET